MQMKPTVVFFVRYFWTNYYLNEVKLRPYIAFVSGIWDLFDYDYHSLPYKIFNQPDPDELCLEIGEKMELVFTFLPVARKNADLVWRYESNILACLFRHHSLTHACIISWHFFYNVMIS